MKITMFTIFKPGVKAPTKVIGFAAGMQVPPKLIAFSSDTLFMNPMKLNAVNLI